MKKVTCSDMGGPCNEEFVKETAEEAATAGYQHIKATSDKAHQALKAEIDAASDKDKAKWVKGFEKTFASAPDA